MNIDDWKSQIKRGTLEFCILLMIKQRPSYGYEIISTLEKYPILAAKENTIYPLLRRLMKEDYVSSSWQESAEGLPPRKYYSVTDKGLEYISAMSEEWDNLLNAINEIIAGADTGRNLPLLFPAPAAASDRRTYRPDTQHSGAAYPACLAAATAAHGGKRP